MRSIGISAASALPLTWHDAAKLCNEMQRSNEPKKAAATISEWYERYYEEPSKKGSEIV